MTGIAVAAAAACASAPAGGDVAQPGQLAFSSGERIFKMNADGSGRTLLTAGNVAAQPAWSPDGTTIAFSRADKRADSRIWTMGVDGGGAHRVSVKGPREANDSSPTWSPDGKRLAFARTRFASGIFVSDLITVAADGSDQRVISSVRTKLKVQFLSAPAWSPDGTHLLYTRTILDNHSFFRPSLYSIAPDGSDRRLVVRDAGDGDWSPDGSRIAFASVRDRNGETCGSDECSYDGEIYTARPDGSDPRRLTDSKANDDEPDWSPDGQWIAFASDRNYPDGENPEIYSMRADGSCVTWLTNGTARSESPSWDPRGGPADPGICGDAGRQPISEVDKNGVASKHQFPLYWLGAIAANGLLLSYVDAEYGGETSLIYDDCARFDSTQCPFQVQLQEHSVCHFGAFPLARAKPPKLSVVRGAVVFETGSDEDGTELYTGRTVIRIFAGGRAAARRVIDALTPVRGDGHGDLPRIALPRNVMRGLRRTTAVYRRLGSAAAAGRRLRISTYAVRRRVGLLRALRRTGPVRQVHCGH